MKDFKMKNFLNVIFKYRDIRLDKSSWEKKFTNIVCIKTYTNKGASFNPKKILFVFVTKKSGDAHTDLYSRTLWICTKTNSYAIQLVRRNQLSLMKG
jgi:hypothetical protein